VLGSKVGKPFEELEDIVFQIRFAVGHLLSEEAETESSQPVDVRREIISENVKAGAVLTFSRGTKDVIEPRLSALIVEIEAICRPIIEVTKK
jgi:hypothetical protein